MSLIDLEAWKVRSKEQAADLEVYGERLIRYRSALLAEREKVRRLCQAGDALLAYAPEEAVLRWKIAKEAKP